MASPRTRDIVVFVMSVLIAAIPTVTLLWSHDGDPSALLRIGDRSASRSFVEQSLPDPVLVAGFGHDGQQFYVIARTFPNMQDADGHVDRLKYRARRVLFPALVSPFPAGDATVWAMLGVNLIAIGAAGIAVSRLAKKVAAPWWIGMTVGLSPALIISARASLADALAFGLAVWGAVLWRKHLWWAVALFTLAAFARETSLVVPAACLLVGPRARERLAMLVPVRRLRRLDARQSERGSTRPTPARRRPSATRHVSSPCRSTPSASSVRRPRSTSGSCSSSARWRRRGGSVTSCPRSRSGWASTRCSSVTAATGVAEDTLNLARLTPLAIPGIALASRHGPLHVAVAHGR